MDSWLRALDEQAVRAQRLLRQEPELARQVAGPLTDKVVSQSLKLADAPLLPLALLKKESLELGTAVAQCHDSLIAELGPAALDYVSWCYSLREALKSLPGKEPKNCWLTELGRLQRLRKQDHLARKKALLKKSLLPGPQFTMAAAALALLLFVLLLLAANNARL